MKSGRVHVTLLTVASVDLEMDEHGVLIKDVNIVNAPTHVAYEKAGELADMPESARQPLSFLITDTVVGVLHQRTSDMLKRILEDSPVSFMQAQPEGGAKS